MLVNCVTLLYFSNQSNDTKNHCQKLVKPYTPLPLSKYLYGGTWVIQALLNHYASQDFKLRDSTQVVNSPLGVLL